jgi:oligoribonuclease NrnB/cAMP/cGMP phosphodiesterase (DHH superfamily)
MKNLVIYHDHCTDGFGAAFAAWLKLGDENTEYLPVNYGQANTLSELCNLSKKPIDDNTTLIILDFSLPRRVMDELFDKCKPVVWLDHHKTAFELYELPATKFTAKAEGTHIELDNDRSGAMISWNYFHPEIDAPMFIKHIDDRDRWQFKIADSKEFHCALASMKPWSFSQWQDFFTTYTGYEDNKVYHDMYTSGRAILRAHEQNVNSSFNAGKCPCMIPWKKVIDELEYVVVDATGLACNTTPHLASDIGHKLANESLTFGLCWYMGHNGKAKISLRSNGDYDVSAIAKVFGGGGHKNAAGFEIDMKTLMGWMK